MNNLEDSAGVAAWVGVVRQSPILAISAYLLGSMLRGVSTMRI